MNGIMESNENSSNNVELINKMDILEESMDTISKDLNILLSEFTNFQNQRKTLENQLSNSSYE